MLYMHLSCTSDTVFSTATMEKTVSVEVHLTTLLILLLLTSFYSPTSISLNCNRCLGHGHQLLSCTNFSPGTPVPISIHRSWSLRYYSSLPPYLRSTQFPLLAIDGTPELTNTM